MRLKSGPVAVAEKATEHGDYAQCYNPTAYAAQQELRGAVASPAFLITPLLFAQPPPQIIILPSRMRPQAFSSYIQLRVWTINLGSGLIVELFVARTRRSSCIKQASPLNLHKVVRRRFAGNFAVSMMNFARGPMCVACFAETYCLLNQLCIKPPLPGWLAWPSRCLQIPGQPHTTGAFWCALSLLARRFFWARASVACLRDETRNLLPAPRCWAAAAFFADRDWIIILSMQDEGLCLTR